MIWFSTLFDFVYVHNIETNQILLLTNLIKTSLSFTKFSDSSIHHPFEFCPLKLTMITSLHQRTYQQNGVVNTRFCLNIIKINF